MSTFRKEKDERNKQSEETKRGTGEERKGVLKYGIEIVLSLSFILILLLGLGSTGDSVPEMTYTEFLEKVEQEEVDYVTIHRGTTIMGVTLKDGTSTTTINLNNDEFISELVALGVEDIRTKGLTISSYISSHASLFVTFLLIYIFIKIFAKMGTSFKSVTSTNEVAVVSTVKFADVAGMREEKEELETAILSLTHAEELKSKGVRPVRGVLFEGPPGVGKTLLAKAVAGEAGVNFLSYSGANFSELFVGVGPMRIAEMFNKARQNKPCVVFIDEIDSVGAKRTNGDSGGSREMNNTLTKLLETLDGVGTESGILFIGATNRVDQLDDALLRPGRFDKVIHIGAPRTLEDIQEIIEVHLRGKEVQEGLTTLQIAQLCRGLTGAQIESVLNDAVLESLKSDTGGKITLHAVDVAVMKVLSGGLAKGEHKGDTLKRVAVHEAGHVVMNQILGRKVIKVSVQPTTSGVGGVTMIDQDSAGELHLRSKDDLVGDIMVLYGGMVAEKLVMGNISTGNANDLERATSILHHMVASWGMTGKSILSSSYLSKVSMIQDVPKDILKNMDELGLRIEKEVTTILSDKGVQEYLLALTEKLISEKVLYDLSNDEVEEWQNIYKNRVKEI